MAIDNRLQVFNEEGQSVDYDILASDVKFLPDGKDLPTKLAEMEQEIEEAGSGDGTVTGVKVGITTYEPTEGVVDLSTPFAGKVDKNGTDSLMTAAEHTKLQNLPTATELTTQLGQKANSADVYPKSQTYTRGEVDDLVDGIEAGERIVFDTEGTPIIDSPLSPDADSVLGAASARWVKEIDNNVKAILAALANIAFTTGKPTWQAVAKRKFNLTMNASTLTGCTGTVVSGDAGNGQVYEGGVRIKLTPTQASYAFTSVTVNGESVDTTSADDGLGSVYLDIVVNGNITVAATAISGRGITFNGTGCSIGAAGVAIGQDLDTTITAEEHFTLPASITVKIGNANVTHTYTRAQDNKTATLHIDATDITGDLTITCTADEDDHAILDLTNVGSGVTVNKANNAHVYEGDTISILPASGNKVSASATVGGNSATLTGDTYAGYTYTIGSGDVSSNGTSIAIEASASALNQSCQITLPATGNGIANVALTDLAGTAITSPVIEGTGIKIVLTPDTDFTISAISIANMTEGTDYTVTDNNGVKTITIQHVTGNVVVSATAWQPSVLTVNTKWANAYKVDNGVETPITSPVELTDGQPLTIVIKSPQVESSGNMVDCFVIAADGYGELYSYRDENGNNGEITANGTIMETDSPTPIHNQTDDVTAEVIVSDNNAVVTFDKTANTCTIYIAAVNGSVSISAKGRLRISANASPGYGHTDKTTRKLVSISAVSAVSFNEPLWWYHYGQACGVAGTSHELKPRRISDGSWRTWSTNSGSQNYRDIPNPYNNTDYYDKFVCSFPIMAIFDTNTFTGNNVPRVLIKSTNEVLVSVDDLRNAYYSKW